MRKNELTTEKLRLLWEVGIKFILTEQNGLLIYRTNCAIVERGMGKSGKETVSQAIKK